MAFYPCTLFQENNALFLSGKAWQFDKFDTKERLFWIRKRHKQLHESYDTICELVQIALERNLKLIIENPATAPHYLTTYWLPSSITDKDRRENGDKFKKPTQYWFFNIEPIFEPIFEPITYKETQTIHGITANREVERSMITSEYANRFIRQWILDKDGKIK